MVRLRVASCMNCKTSLLVNWAVSHSNKAWGANTLIRQHNQVFCHRSFSGGCVGEKKPSKLARFYKKSAVRNEQHQCSPFYFFVLYNRIRSAWKLKGISRFHLKLKWIGIWKITFTKWSLMLLKPAPRSHVHHYSHYYNYLFLHKWASQRWSWWKMLSKCLFFFFKQLHVHKIWEVFQRQTPVFRLWDLKWSRSMY